MANDRGVVAVGLCCLHLVGLPGLSRLVLDMKFQVSAFLFRYCWGDSGSVVQQKTGFVFSSNQISKHIPFDILMMIAWDSLELP